MASGKRQRGQDSKVGPKCHPFPTPAEIDDGTGHYTKAGCYTIYERKYYTKGKIYIIDDANVDEMDVTNTRNGGRHDGQGAPEPHATICTAVAEYFKTDSPYQLKSPPVHSTPEAWNAYWTCEIATWQPDDLIIIYFEGDAGGNGYNYTWFQSRRGASPVNAYSLIAELIRSRRDLLFIVEAYMPTRFHEKFGLRDLASSCGNAVAVVATGAPGQHDDDHRMPPEFSTKLLDEFQEMVCGENDISRYTTKGWSLAELLRGHDDIENNPVALKLQPVTPKHILTNIVEKNCNSADDSILYRIVLDRHYIRYHRKLVFCRDTVEDTKRARTLRINTENRLRDEGFEEDPIDSDDDVAESDETDTQQASTQDQQQTSTEVEQQTSAQGEQQMSVQEEQQTSTEGGQQTSTQMEQQTSSEEAQQMFTEEV